MFAGLVVVALLVAAAGGGWWWLFRAPLPKTKGTITVAGLAAPVEIVRDGQGVPHIYAQSLDDAFYGLGFAQCQDRPWQLELNRRVGAGRLAEILGPDAVDADRFLRRIGLRRVAEAEAAALDPQERAGLEAFARGVNAAMAQGKTPLEFRLLGIKPAPWTVEDSLAWTKMMSLNLTLNWEIELMRYQLAQRLGPEVAARVDSTFTAAGAIILEPGGAGGTNPDAVIAEYQQLYAAAKPYIGWAGGGGGSNAWAVSGEHTASGKPLLANDPHLVVGLPEVWYQAHLICPETDVTGVTLPGLPCIMIGHNRHVAWGQTVACADTSDLFIEKWDAGRQACEFQGQWEPTRQVREVIKVKGKPDVVETVHITRHGPIMAGGPVSGGAALSLRWRGTEPTHNFRAILGMNTAGDAHAFREALRHYATPAMSLVFADDAGNIGYVTNGDIPIRAKGSGLMPVPGWTGEYEWTGYIPFDEQPQLFNPPTGRIVSCNNQVAGDAYPHHVSWDFMPPWRANRIQQVLLANEQLTPADSQQLQLDVFSAPGLEFAQHCQGLQPTDVLEQRALQALLTWDGYLTPETVGGSIYEVMLDRALHRAYLPLIGPGLIEEWLGKGNILQPAAGEYVGRSIVALLSELRRRDPSFFTLVERVPGRAAAAQVSATAEGAVAAGAQPGAGTAYADPWDRLLAESLRDAVAYLRGRLGDDPASWQWGKLHRFHLKHPMSDKKPLHLLFPGREVPMGGDTSTPMQTAQPGHQPYGVGGWMPSYRLVVDLADVAAAHSIMPGGQSGHPGSPHYLDSFDAWYRGELRPMPFTRAAVAQAAVSTLHLKP